MTIEEGKRDNQLLPYLEMYNEKTGQNKSLGEFKSMMLKKLANQGTMHNISKQSNYYLVGAVKYYFAGYLTINKDLSVFKGDEAQDEWNLPVCAKLNALVLVLRNAYIDTVGQTFLEPEDFGEMDLPSLLKKYKKEIAKELGIPQKNEEDGINRIDTNPKVGSKNYTFDIMYEFHDCEKYNQATSPGAWCITYGQNHYNGYTRATNGHFVIFRQDGYESTKRIEEKDKWKIDPYTHRPKPQDEYGNSLIAYVQSNKGPEPGIYEGAPLITSRWNHGEDFNLEADRAYTPEEFEEITGVGQQDLDRIYAIWKAYKKDDGEGIAKADKKEEKKKFSDALREVKYLQMRINGGENPQNLVATVRLIDGSEDNWAKSTRICRAVTESGNYDFVMDRKKILFDTFAEQGGVSLYLDSEDIINSSLCIIRVKDMRVIFNKRTHSLLEIDGIKLFKGVPANFYFGRGSKFYPYFTVAMSRTMIAVIDLKTYQPLKLPNGNCWCNEVYAFGLSTYRTQSIEGHSFATNGLIELIYDSSSNEKYFYDTDLHRYVDIPKRIVQEEEAVPVLCTGHSTNNLYEIRWVKPVLIQHLNPQNIRSDYSRNDNFGCERKLMDKNLNDFSFDFEACGEHIHLDSLKNTQSMGNDFLALPVEKQSYRVVKYAVYDFKKNDVIKINGETLISDYNSPEKINNFIGFCYRPNAIASTDIVHLYYIPTQSLLKNPYGNPSDFTFRLPSLFDSNYRMDKQIVAKAEEIKYNPMEDWDAYREKSDDVTFYINSTTGEISKTKGQIKREQEELSQMDSEEQSYSIQEQDIINMVKAAINEILKRK